LQPDETARDGLLKQAVGRRAQPNPALNPEGFSLSDAFSLSKRLTIIEINGLRKRKWFVYLIAV